MSHDRRPRKPTLHERLDRLFYLLWKRNEKLKERLRNIMSVADDIKTILAEAKEKSIALDTKMDAIGARLTGLKNAIAALKQQLADAIEAGGGAISAEDASAIMESAQAVEDSTDVASAKADILANTEGDEEPPVEPVP